MLEPVLRAGETYALPQDWSEAEALDYWFAPDKSVFVLEDDAGALLGVYYLKPNQLGGGAHVCNCGYVTALEAQGKGVARSMLAFSLEEAKRLGFQAMQYNFVLASNLRAIDTWKRAGFTEIGRIPKAFRMPDGEMVDALILHRFL